MTKYLLLAATLTLGCASEAEDSSMYLTGTEESAVQTEDGEYVCESPKKVLICHIPPGNPDNAHTICVGAAAVKAHERNHGDPVGACDDGDPGEPDAGGDPGTDPDASTPDEVIDGGSGVPEGVE